MGIVWYIGGTRSFWSNELGENTTKIAHETDEYVTLRRNYKIRYSLSFLVSPYLVFTTVFSFSSSASGEKEKSLDFMSKQNANRFPQ